MKRTLLAGIAGLLGAVVATAQEPRQEIERLRREVESARQVARQAQEQFDLLALAVRLRDAEEAAAQLFPAWPDRVPALQTWLAEAAALAGQSAAVAAALTAIRTRANGSDEQGWRFAEERDRFLHDTLARLAADLERFGSPDGLLADVQRRLAWARSVRAESIDERGSQWQAAIAEIGSNPVYGGLELRPQLGLVPLGADRRSGLWEFAHLRSGRIAQRDAEGRVELAPDTGLVFVLLPGGTFRMGAQSGDPGEPNYDPAAGGGEMPVREVRLEPFFVAKFEMTCAQWRQLATGGAGPGDKADDAALPATGLSWTQCRVVLARHALDLPTEAQWEYACRARTATPFWTGVEAQSLAGAANLADAQSKRQGVAPWHEDWLDDGQAWAARVGSYHPNPFGLFDTHGNVAEWCRDGATPGATALGTAARAARGGSYGDLAVAARSAARLLLDPEHRDARTGVRPVRAVR